MDIATILYLFLLSIFGSATAVKILNIIIIVIIIKAFVKSGLLSAECANHLPNFSYLFIISYRSYLCKIFERLTRLRLSRHLSGYLNYMISC